MSLEQNQACLATSRVTGSSDSRAAGRKIDEYAEPSVRLAQTIVAEDAPAFLCHPLTRDYPRHVTTPRAGELQLWRFRCEWLPVPVQEGESWLSKMERERARLHPNAALRKRFISARVVVRWIVGNLFDCDPRAVDLQDDGNEKLRARHPRDGRGITIDIAYGGIWIVVGIASGALGLSVVVPSPGAAPDETPEAARRRARYSSLCSALRYAPADVDVGLLLSDRTACAFDLEEHGYWYVLDVPMAGKICAAVALALAQPSMQPLTRVHTIGWPKALTFGVVERS